MQIGHTGLSIQTRVHSKGQMREKFHCTVLLAVTNHFTQQNESISNSYAQSALRDSKDISHYYYSFKPGSNTNTFQGCKQTSPSCYSSRHTSSKPSCVLWRGWTSRKVSPQIVSPPPCWSWCPPRAAELGPTSTLRGVLSSVLKSPKLTQTLLPKASFVEVTRAAQLAERQR